MKKLKGKIYYIKGKPIYFDGEDSFPGCNSLFIDDKKKVIIDPASDYNMLRNIAKNNKVDVNINTHYHGDHVMFNPLFNSSSLYVHIDDAPCYSSFDELIKALKNPWLYHWEKNMIRIHLDRLIKMGKIVKTDDGKFIKLK